MAIWQYDFHLIPEQGVVAQVGHLPIAIQDAEQRLEIYWTSEYLTEDIATEIDRILPAGSSWRSGLQIWGSDDGSRIDISYRADRIESVFIRFDLRQPSLKLMMSIVDLARLHEWLILTNEGYLLKPSIKSLLSRIRQSPSFRFVEDPEQFLRALSDEEP
ncbi:MAG: hypothetical protein ACE363_06730 [Alphaproteobacteria bacterium]